MEIHAKVLKTWKITRNRINIPSSNLLIATEINLCAKYVIMYFPILMLEI